MNWFAWKQHRKQFLVAGIVFVLFAALLIPTGISFWHTYQHTLTTCGRTDTCNQLNNDLFQSQFDGLLLHLVPMAVVLTPILLGIFWGVPFLAREYADGTNKLAWTQGISRKRWLSVKLVWVLLGTILCAACFTALNTWWAKTNNALTLNRFGPIQFESQGVVVIGYAVFAVSLGIFFGAWFKRTMAAIAATFVLLVALINIVTPNFVRPYYETPLSYRTSLIGTAIPVMGQTGPISSSPMTNSAALMVSSNIVSSSDQPVNWANPPSQCIRTAPPGFIGGGEGVRAHAVPAPGSKQEALDSQNGGPVVSLNCLQSLGYVMEIKYQPANRYWDFQWIETGIFLVLSAFPIAATYWLVVKRDA